MWVALKNVTWWLIDTNPEIVFAWQEALGDCDQVQAIQGSIFDRQVDALVSPANSFGFMDGGLDLAISEHFGWSLEGRVRQTLLEEHDGELPVGQALIVETGHDQVRWLISAPTMRVPMRVGHTVNAYLAFRAILRAVRAHNLQHQDDDAISTVACPGLGTGEGGMAPQQCAAQMRYAYDVCVNRQLMTKGGLAASARNHMALLGVDDA